MDLFNGIFPNIMEIVRTLWHILTDAGYISIIVWVFIVWFWVKFFFGLYLAEIQHQYAHSQEWVFLSIKVPRENLVSTLSVESIFSQMHALHSSVNFAQKYVEGKDQLWYSLEIVSFGGKLSFILRIPKNTRNLVEAAFYAQYPVAEITEVSDYMENIEYDPETSDFDLFGWEWKLVEDYAIPIKTYRDFEHPTAEEKILDPLAGHFEALGKMEPHEFYGVQILIQPLGDGEWKPHGEALAKKLAGEEVPHESGGIIDFLMTPFENFAHGGFLGLFGGGGHGHGHDDGGKPKNNWQFLTDLEKERVNLVQRKISKPGYKTKIRHMYIAPKGKTDGSKKGIVIGSYRALGSAMTNQFKPDTKYTWTSLDYKISPTLEKPYLDHEINRRKKVFFNAYKTRDIHVGIPMFIFNIEELATLFHFPISTVAAAVSMQRTESKKSSAPVNLPVSDY